VKENSKFLLVIVGPTAVGKTALSIELANHLQTEIISADSRQIFKEMELGTAKPDRPELEKIPHHFINSHSIQDSFNAADFEREGLQKLDLLFKKHSVVIAVGGSGLYIDALCSGMDNIPTIDPQVRQALNDQLEKSGLLSLQNRLKDLDPEYYAQVDLNNPQRVVRALEVCIGTGRPYSSMRQKKTVERPFKIIKIGLHLDRDVLYNRIDFRMDRMIEQGLFEEVKSLFQFRHLNALQTVGYSEIFDFLEGKTEKEETIRLLKRNSRRYAKRQLTWFKRDKEIHWFEPHQVREIIDFVESEIGKNHN
jgi:tRNA dimethylallyltransferase